MAVRRMLPGELTKHAVSVSSQEGTKAVNKLVSFLGSSERTSAEKKFGLGKERGVAIPT